MSALFINGAILVMAAATFHGTEYENVAEIGDAYKLLSPLLGTTMASTVFALALLFSGQNATLTGTLAGQIVMEGFINLRLRPWLRRLITRLIAIIPAIIVIVIYGDRGTGPLLILSQVILSLQLPFAVFPLVQFTSERAKMGEFANPGWVKVLAWSVAVVIAALNVWLLYQTVVELHRVGEDGTRGGIGRYTPSASFSVLRSRSPFDVLRSSFGVLRSSNVQTHPGRHRELRRRRHDSAARPRAGAVDRGRAGAGARRRRLRGAALRRSEAA